MQTRQAVEQTWSCGSAQHQASKCLLQSSLTTHGRLLAAVGQGAAGAAHPQDSRVCSADVGVGAAQAGLQAAPCPGGAPARCLAAPWPRMHRSLEHRIMRPTVRQPCAGMQVPADMCLLPTEGQRCITCLLLTWQASSDRLWLTQLAPPRPCRARSSSCPSSTSSRPRAPPSVCPSRRRPLRHQPRRPLSPPPGRRCPSPFLPRRLRPRRLQHRASWTC